MAAAYNRRLVEHLLPAAWDDSFAYGLPAADTAPDPDMPRAKPDPKVGGVIFAHIADIKSAWHRAPIPHPERVALLMRYGFGWEDRETAALDGSSRSTVTRRVERGVGRITAWLNGDDFDYDADADDDVQV